MYKVPPQPPKRKVEKKAPPEPPKRKVEVKVPPKPPKREVKAMAKPSAAELSGVRLQSSRMASKAHRRVSIEQIALNNDKKER
ncbi:hypothetical protein AAMO2058_001379100 [Amorphochlora amoebiformis]